MYFKESGHIAAEFPDLEAVLKLVDEQLFKTRTKLLIQPSLWRTLFQLNINELESVLDLLVKQGLLRDKAMFCCENCSVLNDADEDERKCTSCGESLEEANEVGIFLFEPSYYPDQEYPEDEVEVWDWDKLSGPQLKQVHEAIKSGYPVRTALERLLLLELNVHLNDFDDSGGMTDTVYNVTKYFDADGTIKKLVMAAAKLQSSNPQLEELSKKN